MTPAAAVPCGGRGLRGAHLEPRGSRRRSGRGSGSRTRTGPRRLRCSRPSHDRAACPRSHGNVQKNSGGRVRVDDTRSSRERKTEEQRTGPRTKRSFARGRWDAGTRRASRVASDDARGRRRGKRRGDPRDRSGRAGRASASRSTIRTNRTPVTAARQVAIRTSRRGSRAPPRRRLGHKVTVQDIEAPRFKASRPATDHRSGVRTGPDRSGWWLAQNGTNCRTEIADGSGR